ncbi:MULTISPECIES: DUF1566 domain-containing protein [unclassified Pseudodesulfovibrio]|uniref:Lcl C-terminal domain-containing protein n=1 Tax=unclassified Pseudodesulfovibrio TaxID=2661612 RepID=UPI0013E32848|nr:MULTISPECIES: DUF1566 domain-containing protein [unclassified Pseudodesulfovibrio]MCJ2165257.1 DUF1566 domain-containing protein [Pseudodesulfovibrio sp. S3-i]
MKPFGPGTSGRMALPPDRRVQFLREAEDGMQGISLKNARRVAQAVCVCTVVFLACAGSVYAETFVDNGDDTVTDTLSGLMWSKNGSPGGYVQWTDAVAIASSGSFGGKSGWRMPTKSELLELYAHLGGSKGPFRMDFVGGVPHWSSTVGTWSSLLRELVNMKTGKSETHPIDVGVYSYIWPVRNAN